MTKITVDKALIEQAIEALLNCRPDQKYADDYLEREYLELNTIRAALRTVLAEPVVKDCLTTEPVGVPVDIEDLAHSALQEALSYGLGLDLFMRYFKVVQKASPPPPADVPLLNDDEIADALPWACFDDLIESYSARQLHEALRAIESLVRQEAGLV